MARNLLACSGSPAIVEEGFDVPLMFVIGVQFMGNVRGEVRPGSRAFQMGDIAQHDDRPDPFPICVAKSSGDRPDDQGIALTQFEFPGHLALLNDRIGRKPQQGRAAIRVREPPSAGGGSG